jgi:hypothetical protein
MDWQLFGAFAFGMIIGWYAYFVNRYRKGDVTLGDLTTIIGTLGGGAVLALFDKKTDLFGAYGVGLAVGFFLYFFVLIVLVGLSKNFDSDWFLDGRRKNPPDGYGYGQDARPPVTSMDVHPPGGFHGQNPGTMQNFYIGQPSAAQGQPPLAALRPQFISSADTIIQYCREEWPANQNACNFFAIAVANHLGVKLSGRADQIVDQIRGAGWSALPGGPAARTAAMGGKLVIAGIKSGDFTQPRDEGHVAIVVSGPMNGGGWAPAGYWGSTSPDIAKKGGSGNPISECFREEDSGKIVYAQADI